MSRADARGLLLEIPIMRKAMNGMRSDEAVERILEIFAKTKTNKEACHYILKTKLV